MDDFQLHTPSAPVRSPFCSVLSYSAILIKGQGRPLWATRTCRSSARRTAKNKKTTKHETHRWERHKKAFYEKSVGAWQAAVRVFPFIYDSLALTIALLPTSQACSSSQNPAEACLEVSARLRRDTRLSKLVKCRGFVQRAAYGNVDGSIFFFCCCSIECSIVCYCACAPVAGGVTVTDLLVLDRPIEVNRGKGHGRAHDFLIEAAAAVSASQLPGKPMAKRARHSESE